MAIAFDTSNFTSSCDAVIVGYRYVRHFRYQ